MIESLPSWADPAIRIASAGLGAAVAGPLGGAIGGWLGAALGGSATQLIRTAAEKFGEKAGEGILDTGTDSILGHFKGGPPNLNDLYREILRLSLQQIHALPGCTIEVEADSWFANWNSILASSLPLDLSVINPAQLVPSHLDDLFRTTLERLDAQGSALQHQSISSRTMPQLLLDALTVQLPKRLADTFAVLITTDKYATAWKQADQQFQQVALALLQSIKGDTTQILAGQQMSDAKLNSILEFMAAKRQNDGSLSPAEAKAVLTDRDEWKRKYLELQQSSPSLEKPLAAGDLAGAIQLKTQQIVEDANNQARNYYELGTLHELHLDIPEALDAYRQAWQIQRNPQYGFRYALCAQRQELSAEALQTYQLLLTLFTDPVDVALTQNNLASLYRDAYRTHDAEVAWLAALDTYRTLDQTTPGQYRVEIARTQNNLGVLYHEAHRDIDAAASYREALGIRRVLALTTPGDSLPEVADTLNNRGILYSDTERPDDAEQDYNEALSTYRSLEHTYPSAYALSLPNIASVLNNLANFLSHTSRTADAETNYRNALAINSYLALADPKVYNPSVALTLDNLGRLYHGLERWHNAEDSYLKAIGIRTRLVVDTPAAPWLYRPDLALTLSGLAALCAETLRFKDAKVYCEEAGSLIDPLWHDHPERYGDQLAKILWTRALLCRPLNEADTRACAIVRRALRVAYDSATKLSMQILIADFCKPATEATEAPSDSSNSSASAEATTSLVTSVKSTL